MSNKNKTNKIHDTHFIFATTRGSMNACMELVGFSTSNRVENHWHRGSNEGKVWRAIPFFYISKRASYNRGLDEK